MVSHSTPQSREAKEVSKLAIFETIFFTLLVLAVTIYTDTTTYLLSSILIAPFLLLKTPRSIALSHKIFFYPIIDGYDDLNNFISSYKFKLIIMVLLSISFLIIFYNDGNCACFQVGILNAVIHQIFLFALLSHTIELKNKGIIGLVVTMQLITLPLSLVLVGIFYGFSMQLFYYYLGYLFGFLLLFTVLSITSGLFIRSLAIKFIATVYVVMIELFTNPIKLLENISQNYREQLLINDSFYVPELLPEISKVSHKYSLLAFFIVPIRIAPAIVPIWPLACLYRWSIKSTAWFYFPLAFLANTTQKMKDDKTIKKYIDIQTNSIKLWFNLGVVVFLFISWFGMVFKDKIVDLLEWSKSIYALFDILKGLKLPIVVDSWSVYLVTVSTFIYFVVYYFVDRQQSHIEKGNEGYSKTVNKILFWTIRVHLVLWMVAFGLTLYSSYILYHEMLRDNILSLFNL